MKNTIKITLSEKEMQDYIKMLIDRGFKQIGTMLFEDRQTYVRIYKA